MNDQPYHTDARDRDPDESFEITTTRCPWCGTAMVADRCTECDHVVGMPGRPYVVYGPGMSGDYGDLTEAKAVAALDPPSRVYVRMDQLVRVLEWRARNTMNPDHAARWIKILGTLAAAYANDLDVTGECR